MSFDSHQSFDSVMFKKKKLSTLLKKTLKLAPNSSQSAFAKRHILSIKFQQLGDKAFNSYKIFI